MMLSAIRLHIAQTNFSHLATPHQDIYRSSCRQLASNRKAMQTGTDTNIISTLFCVLTYGNCHL